MIVASEQPAIGFACLPIVGGWSWTLTTRLGGLLAEAEQRYGPRDLTYTILGVEFGGDRPGLWYPGDRRHISIRLSDHARDDPKRAYFQLAHEVVHLLAPNGGGGTIVFEEGLATLFSDEMSARAGAGFFSSDPAYVYAKEMVIKVLRMMPDFVTAARATLPYLPAWTPRDLAEIGSSRIPEDMLASICEPFSDVEVRMNASNANR